MVRGSQCEVILHPSCQQLADPRPDASSDLRWSRITSFSRISRSRCVQRCVLFVLACLTLSCGKDGQQSPASVFPGQVTWIRLEFHDNGHNRPSATRVEDQGQIAAIVSIIETLKFRPPLPGGPATSAPNKVVFGTSSGLVQASWGDGYLEIDEGPVKGRVRMPEPLDVLLQVHRTDATMDPH